MIRLSDVSFEYCRSRRFSQIVRAPFAPAQRNVALVGVDLTIRSGERLALVGRNGAGKTTLLKLMGGLLLPTRGTVDVLGHRDARSIARHVGYVVNEERSFYWRLTGRQNLEFFACLQDCFGRAVRSRIDELLEMVGLERDGDRRVSEYSAGMRQRLALARGMFTDPEILLLDEPTKSLDLVGADVIRELVMDATHGSGKSRILVITTNQLEDVTGMCNRVQIINRHQLVAKFDAAAQPPAALQDMIRQALALEAG